MLLFAIKVNSYSTKTPYYFYHFVEMETGNLSGLVSLSIRM